MLEKNLSEIAKYNPALAQAIANHKIIGSYGFELAKSGDVVLLYESLPFHSLDDPQQEALITFNNLQTIDKSTITLVYGLGLGYLFKRVYLSSQGRILIYEPNLDILRITLENVDFSLELADDRVMLLNKKEDIEPAFSKYYLSNDPVNMCFSEVYKKLFPDRIQEISQELSFMKGHYNNNYFTLFNASKEWVDMSLSNFNNIISSQYIDCLKNKFKDIPALIVSAGPSLLKNVAQINELKGKAVILAVGSAVRILEKNNVIPDFSLYIDVSERITPQLDGVKNLNNINFIVQPYTHNKIYESESKRKFLYLPSNDSFSNWISKTLKLDNSDYFNRGTVSVSALYSAINFGCNPIIITGQDLAYTLEGTTYADSDITVYYEDEKLTTKGLNGENLPTNSSFLMFQRYFENIARDLNGSPRLINCTEGGAFIKGMEHMPLKEAANIISNASVNVEHIITQTEDTYNNPLSSGKLQLVNSLKGNYSSLSKLVVTVKKSQSLSNKITRELNKPDINKNHIINNLKSLFENNGKMDNIINNELPLFSPLIQEASYAFQQGYGRYKSMQTLVEIKSYLELTDNYYEAILKEVPGLNQKLESILKVKK